MNENIHAAIDIGTNSMHLVVAKLSASDGVELITSERERIRIGEGMGPEKILKPEAIDRAMGALTRMTTIAFSYTQDVSILATSATREAKNRSEFLDRAKDELDVDIQVISGLEEARLIHEGVIHSLALVDKSYFICDIGGGSTEFVAGSSGEILNSKSISLGAIVLTDKFFRGKNTKKEVDACRQYVASRLAAMVAEFSEHNPNIAIGCSGTISTVATIAGFLNGKPPRQINGADFTIEDVDNIIELLVSTPEDRRHEIDGIEGRTDILLGGAILLSEIMYALKISTMSVSEYALREGILYDQLSEISGSHSLGLRLANVNKLAKNLDPNIAHSKHVAGIALSIFDQIQDLHNLGQEARELLNYAAILHNIGLFISHSSHHKHSYYVIRHSDILTGFNEREIEVMAQISRYHRKAKPSKTHWEYERLNFQDRSMVAKLAGILRIAIGLDRRHDLLVQEVLCMTSDDDSKLLIQIKSTVDDTGVDLEVYAANERASLLSNSLSVDVAIS